MLLTGISFVSLAQTPLMDSLQSVVDRHPQDTIGVIALDKLIDEYMRRDLQKGLACTYKLLAMSRDLNYPLGQALAYTGFIHAYQGTGHLDSAQHYVDRYTALYKKHPGHKRIAINYTNTAGLFYRVQGKYKEAVPYLIEALHLIELTGNKTSLGGQNLNVGNVYFNMSDLKQAVVYHLKALTLFEEVGNKRGQSFCHQGLGADFLALHQYETARKYLLQAEKLKSELGDKRGRLSTWMSLGELYQQTNKPEESMRYFTKALTRAEELNLSVEGSHVLFNMGSLLKSQHRYDQARQRFLQALPHARQAADSLMASRIQAELVMMNNSQQQLHKKEEQTLLGNLVLSQEKGDRAQRVDGHLKLADWYASRKQFEQAFNNLKLAQQVNDTVRGGDVQVQLKRLEEEYKSEKKEREIALLKKDQEVQALALEKQKVINLSIIIMLIFSVAIGVLIINRYRVMNAAKRALEIERVRNNIARDLHDEMGSALSSINILSQVALTEKDSDAQTYLQRIGDQSTRIMESMSDIVWSINPDNDSMSRVIVKMREFASEILDPQNIEYRFSQNVPDGLVIDTDRRKNLFLIFKESVNNAAKYSNASKIEIDLHQHEQTMVMRVNDNGHGFDEQTIRPGNGLRNLRERAREISGTLTIESKVGAGTAIELHLPLA
jgi:two-component system sensor histidine kinase UhpB